MRALRLLTAVLLGLAALLSATMGVVLVLAAISGSSDTQPGVLIGAGSLFLAIALVVAWGARVAFQSGTRTHLLLLVAVGAFFALFPINSLVGWPGYVFNVICGAVAAGALIALVFGRATHKSGEAA
jgi:hypothetical protein